MTNPPDGAVEAVFEGEPEAVAALVEWCRHGPRADVRCVGDDTSEEPEGPCRFESLLSRHDPRYTVTQA